MDKKKFWKWINQMAPKVTDQEGSSEEVTEERTLVLNGTIAEESWFDDDVTPGMFRSELYAGSGNITVLLNSPGGDCIAAAQIYNMLCEYPGKVTIKIDGLAASAASVIAMAGDEVRMSPVSLMMVHNPATIAFGDHNEMQKAIDLLDTVKESIINAYALKTGLSRAKLSHMMEAETWLDANKAVELGFADNILFTDRGKTSEDFVAENGVMFSRKAVNKVLVNKLKAKYGQPTKKSVPKEGQENYVSAEPMKKRLEMIERLI